MRQQIFLILLFVSLFPASLLAVPAAPDLVDLQQPDGSKIKGRIKGDESRNWTETEKGHTVLRDKASGYWEYAEQASDGSLRGTGIRVLPDASNAPADLPKGLKPPRNVEHQKMMKLMLQDTYEQRLTAAPSIAAGAPAVSSPNPPGPDDWTPVPVSGNKNLLVILVSFANRAMSTPSSSWADSTFTLAAKSVAKFYKENSFDTMSIIPVIHTQNGSPAGVVSVTIPSNHPNNAGSTNFTTDQAWCNSALQQAAPYVNFNSFDTNGDGNLDTSEIVIYFVAAGYEASGSASTPSIWAHAWWTSGTGLTAGTKNVQRWGMNGELFNSTTRMQMGVIAHELGHQLCGLPDLYDISDKNQGMGDFSLMAGGSWGKDIGETSGTTPVTLDLWSREYLGWSTPITPTSGGAITLEQPLASPWAGHKLVLPETSSTEYFLVENRYPMNWDLGLSGLLQYYGGWQGGLLITHIDITAGTAGWGDINSYDDTITDPGHQGVVPVQANTAGCDMLQVNSTCRGRGTTLYYSGNSTSWAAGTIPSSNYYSGVPTGFGLADISTSGASMIATLVTPVSRAISIAKSGNGSGTVTSTPAGISCGATCSANLYDATTVVLHAVADQGAVFSGWSGGGCSGTGDCTFVVSEDTTITATFTNPLPVTIDTKPASLVNNPGATFTFSSSVLGVTFECSVDGSPYQSCTSPYTTPALADGPHSFTVRARDGLDYTSVSPATHTWTVTPSSNNVGVTVDLGTSYYTTISSALASLVPGMTATLKLKALEFPEGLSLGVPDSVVTLQGGYDGSLASRVGVTTILGTLTISNGTLTVERLAIR